MSLLQMSLSGSVIILVIAGLRVLLLNKLPKKMFLVLWWIALLRLLLPVLLPSSFSIYSLFPQLAVSVEENGNQLQVLPADFDEQGKESVSDPAQDETILVEGAEGINQWEDASMQNRIRQDVESAKADGAVMDGSEKIRIKFSLWQILWLAGMLFTAIFFLIAYIRSYKEFRISFPIEEERVKNWLQMHRIRRRVSIRRSECVSTPLTYGMIRPVILLPKNVEWDDGQLFYVLEHEFVHIRRFDMATKLILAAVLCIHWFNPLIWIMYSLFNRDLEISCDEEVIRRFGEEKKSGYARTLIFMEEKKAGLIPLYNGFSKNAIEERIRAVMKIRKTSAAALMAAVILVCVVFFGFATTAKEKVKDQREYLREMFEGSFSEKECEMLTALWIDDYEDMTVSEYQEKLWTLTDTQEYIKLIDRLSQQTWTFETDEKQGEALEAYFEYYYYVFEPLCNEKWTKQEFAGAVVWTEGEVYTVAASDHMPQQDTAELEYVLALSIEQPDKLTAGQYYNTYRQIVEDMEAVLKERTEPELADQRLMEQILDKETKRIAAERSDENLTIIVNYGFRALENGNLLEDQINIAKEYLDWSEEQIQEQIELIELSIEQSRQEVESSLGAYQQYGLTWEIIPTVDTLDTFLNPDIDLKMYWKGKEVRGICDEEQGKWISYYAGNSKYSSDAIDLYVVYEAGVITGLRKATEEETQTWTQIREENMLEQREDRYPPAGREDYDSLLALMKPDYENMSVAEFNDKLLDWCNEDHDRMERISEDAAQGAYMVTLTEAEKSFIELTFGLSREENYRLINNLRTDSPQEEKDVRYGGINRSFYKESDDGLAFSNLRYYFCWYISDRKKLTVGQRDSAIREFMNEVEQTFSAMELDELLIIKENELVSLLKETAKKYSDATGGLLTIEIEEDNVSIDRLDEREVMWERER